MSEEDTTNQLPETEPLEQDYLEIIKNSTFNSSDVNKEEPSQEEIKPKKQKYSDVYTKKGKVLNRNRILSVILFVFVFFIIFFLFILPLFKIEKKEEVSLDKAGKTYIPEVISMWEKETKEEKQVVTQNEYREELHDEELDAIIAEIPMSDEAKSDSPSITNSSSTSTRPITNRNPVQKQITRMQWNNGTISQSTSQLQTLNTNTVTQNEIPSRSDYVNSLSSLGQNQNEYTALNNQSDKQSFFNGNVSTDGSYQWNSVYSLFKGSILTAVLETGINSDLPGVVIARVTKNVYSSLDGSYLLIPAGSRLFASYNSSISIGQSRVQVSWNTLIRPDGLEYNLGNFTGVDTKGYSGYAGFVDENFFEYAKAMGIVSLFSIINGGLDNAIARMPENAYTDQLVAENRTVVNQLSGSLLERTMNIQPTIIIPQGKEVNIITNRTINFPPLESYPVTNTYTR